MLVDKSIVKVFLLLFFTLFYSFFSLNLYAKNNKIGKQTIDLSIAELEQTELQQQDLINKEEAKKKDIEAKNRQAKIAEKQLKKETKQKYKQAKKKAKLAKIEQKKQEVLHPKLKEKITPLKKDKMTTNSTTITKDNNEKQTAVKQAKKKATKTQKKAIKKAEKMTFIDDDAILDIIDNQISQITYKKIRVSTKNKGVPTQCLLNKNTQNQNIKTSSKREEEQDNQAVVERKKRLKKHILKSLKANEVSEELIKKIYDNLEELPSVATSNKKFNQTSSIDFINNYQIPARTKSGKMYKKLYKKDLQTVNDVFYVEPEAILTIWAIETNYGNFIGKTNAFNALYSSCLHAKTLPRIEFFENNLIMLAKLVDYGYFKYDVVGSYAGALGGCQFMPDSFYRYGVSFDGGKADIINNNKDVFASIGNYLYNTGWRQYQGILTEISLPEDFDVCLTGFNTSKTIAEWKKLGIKLNESKIGEQYFNDDDKIASIIITDINNEEIDYNDKRAFLVYDNIKVILGYNSSINYGITAGLIYDALSKEE